MSRRSRFAIAEPADGSVLRWPGAASKFALLGEVLWVGILVAVASLPVVTWPAAFAAGASHLRRFLRGEGATVGQFVDDVRRAVLRGAVVGAASLLVALLIVLDLAAVITWQYALLAVPAVGMLVFAVVAVQESRGVPA